MMGRDKLFVCWLEAAPTVVVEQSENSSGAPQIMHDGTMTPTVPASPAISFSEGRSLVASREP